MRTGAVIFAVLALLALPAGSRAGAGEPAAVVVGYADLVDAGAVTRTGRLLVEAMRDPATPRAHLQPFLAPFSSLLPYAVEMLRGEGDRQLRDVVERWPAGAPQPAWVALFREGRYRAVADATGRARLFLPGDDADAAWRAHYHVVRHALNALAAAADAPVEAEVFAYRNDYRRQELRLNPQPLSVSGRSFPAEGAALDLDALAAFFRQDGRLEGAQLDADDGLVLFASPGRQDTLAGEPVTLADLAVAYRAVFHAGDNDAFVSLDPSADPTAATVNFGGTLADTRLGAAALAADRFFKTLSIGLDPKSFHDRRQQLRERIPGFLTSSEWSFVDRKEPSSQGWTAVRTWFYPDSISVDADPVEGIAVVTRPQFTADAERLGGDGAAASKRRPAAPPEVRETIRALNADYTRYAEAVPEIADLAAVARLMAVASWLRRSETSWLDLDALLAVELPAVSTPRTLERIISAEYVSAPPGETLTRESVASRSHVVWLTPMLKRAVGDFFGDPATLATFLCLARKPQGARPCSDYDAEAAGLFASRRGEPLRSLVRTEQDLKALIELLSQKVEYPLPPEAQRPAQAEDEALLARLRGDLERAQAEARATPGEAARAEVRRIEGEMAAIFARHHGAPAWRTKSVIHVNGGISMRPGEFSIRSGGASPALLRFKALARDAVVGGAPGPKGGRLIRSKPPGGKRRGPPPAPQKTKPAPKAGGAPAPAPAAAKSGRPLPAAPPPGGTAAPATNAVSVPAGAAGDKAAVGALDGNGRIIFRKSGP